MGGRKPTISDEEILREIALSPDPVVTATEISNRIEMTRQGVNNRLDTLCEEGLVRKKSVGAKAVVYWLSEEGKQHATQA